MTINVDCGGEKNQACKRMENGTCAIEFLHINIGAANRLYKTRYVYSEMVVCMVSREPLIVRTFIGRFRDIDEGLLHSLTPARAWDGDLNKSGLN